MPVTQGQSNPKWTREETLLALELYFKQKGPVHRGHNSVLELSKYLRSLSIHSKSSISKNFRNADGVALKLQNLHTAITNKKGGLSSSKGDRAAAADYPYPRAESLLHGAAKIIRIAADLNKIPIIELNISEDEMFTEGKVVTARHTFRERNPTLRKKFFAKSRDEDGQLKCEMCDIRAPVTSKHLSDSIFEVHHVTPLTELKENSKTRINDLSLLCACCHRMIHKMISLKKRWVGVEEARKKRLSSNHD